MCVLLFVGPWIRGPEVGKISRRCPDSETSSNHRAIGDLLVWPSIWSATGAKRSVDGSRGMIWLGSPCGWTRHIIILVFHRAILAFDGSIIWLVSIISFGVKVIISRRPWALADPRNYCLHHSVQSTQVNNCLYLLASQSIVREFIAELEFVQSCLHSQVQRIEYIFIPHLRNNLQFNRLLCFWSFDQIVHILDCMNIIFLVKSTTLTIFSYSTMSRIWDSISIEIDLNDVPNQLKQKSFGK